MRIIIVLPQQVGFLALPLLPHEALCNIAGVGVHRSRQLYYCLPCQLEGSKS